MLSERGAVGVEGLVLAKKIFSDVIEDILGEGGAIVREQEGGSGTVGLEGLVVQEIFSYIVEDMLVGEGEESGGGGSCISKGNLW